MEYTETDINQLVEEAIEEIDPIIRENKKIARRNFRKVQFSYSN